MRHLIAALGASLSLASAAPAALGPDDFATGRAITTREGEPLQTLLLDLPVYRGSVEPALSDLRVFNARGEAVPHAIRALARPDAPAAEAVPVPVFRLPARRGVPRDGTAAPGLARSHGVEVRLSEDGAIVRVEPVAEAPGEAPHGGAVLVDLSRLSRRVVGLDLALGPEPSEFVLPLRVEASDDLVRFEALPARAALARLAQAGHRIERSDVTLSGVDARYLLLSAADGSLPVEVTAVHAQLAPATPPPPRSETRVAGTAVAGEPGVHRFDLGGEVPVDRLQVSLPEPNTVIRAELLSSARADGPWTRVFDGLLYRLERDATLRNAPVSLAPRRHRYFRLVVSPQGGGLGGGAPVLEASWLPEQLLFVARGPAPFALGYGRAGAPDTRFAADELLRTAGVASEHLPRRSAALGRPVPRADASVLAHGEEPIPARTLALWAFLVLSVAVVLGLCVRLLRQMGGEDDDPAAKA